MFFFFVFFLPRQFLPVRLQI